ncbi:hypothetical protein BLNAU_1507 [Blattamonas nauphoetae]|uniref:Uncharacterized protein n=1 Tax=Blattamonas nauphoetae TaxID=2049346 RepID=A0ABQ9YIA4_9EUKA|nr:hypothetical protein BLNAU_1507 [Blattamonas nauphoetae]
MRRVDWTAFIASQRTNTEPDLTRELAAVRGKDARDWSSHSAVSSSLSPVDVVKEEAQRITDQLSHFILEKGETKTVESEEEKSVQLVPNRPHKRMLEMEEEDQEQNEDTSEMENSSESDQFEGENEKTAEEKGKENQPPKELERHTQRQNERKRKTRYNKIESSLTPQPRKHPQQHRRRQQPAQKPIQLPPPAESGGRGSDEAVCPKQLDDRLTSRVDCVDWGRPYRQEQAVHVSERSVGAVCVERDVPQLCRVGRGPGRGEWGERGEENQPVLRERTRRETSDETGPCSASSSQSEIGGGAERVEDNSERGIDANETSEEEREAKTMPTLQSKDDENVKDIVVERSNPNLSQISFSTRTSPSTSSSLPLTPSHPHPPRNLATSCRKGFFPQTYSCNTSNRLFWSDFG